MIPFLDTWRDDNLTLGYDFGPGELVTQGGSIRYVDKPKREGSVLTGVPLIDRGNEKPTEQEVINVPPADSIKDGAVTLRYDLGPGELTTQGGDIGYTGKEPQNEKSLDDVLAYVDTLAPRKPTVPDPEVINIPPAPFSQQEIEMRQAEQALQEEREADKQRGSEGYEAKEDGVFARLKNWGSGVHDYLFGKDNEMDELMDAVDDIEAKKAKEEKGVVGYYGDKLADFMLGPNYGKEWDEIKKEISEKGLLGYIPQKGATLLENMARSPYAKFTDPTTVLGGQRRMVNDIDAYQNTQGLEALRNDLLKQDLLYGQTRLGQAERLSRYTPEEQEVILKNAQGLYPQRAYQGVGSKNAYQAAYMTARDWIDNDEVPAEEAYQRAADLYGVPVESVKAATAPKSSIANENPKQWAIRKGMEDYANNPEAYPGGEGEAIDQRYNSLPLEMRRAYYQSQNPQEKQTAKQLETASKEYAEMTAKEFAEFGSNYDKTLRGLQVLKKALDDPNNKTMFGGWFNSTIQKAASELGYKTTNEQEALAVFNNAMRSMHGEAARQIDPSGRLTDAEQRRIDSTIIDMNQGIDYNRRMVKDTLARMALGKIAAEEKFAMVYSGAGPREVSDFLNRKYYYTRLYPEQYIDPNTIEQHKFDKGQFIWSNKVNDWLFDKETE